MERVNITCRLPVEDVRFLDTLAETMERDRSYLIKQAVTEYIALQRWQVEEIEKAIAEADARQLATDADIRNAFAELRS